MVLEDYTKKALGDCAKLHVGLIDADLIYGGTRHPNLALLKIAGFLRDNGFVRGGWERGARLSYDLITVENAAIDWLDDYDRVYVSRVFSFTNLDELSLMQWAKANPDYERKLQIGGTGSYANLSVDEGFSEKRCEDMMRLEKNDEFLA